MIYDEGEYIMLESKTTQDSARVYTTHGVKKNQGVLAIVNNRMALAYTEGKGKDQRIVGYTYVEEIMHKAGTAELPQYTVDF